jgi:type VI secretion system secreted protein VgrG
MSDLSQANTALRVATPLGPDALIALALQGEERLSTPFEYVLETEVGVDGLDLAGLPGQSVDVTLVDGQGAETVLNAIVWAVRREDRRCTLTLRPGLARLGLTSDNRIYQDQGVLDILESVLGESGLGPWRQAVTAAPAPRPYCVQFGETDLAFVSRLLEEEGLGYFFEHEAGQHTLVVFDDVSGCLEAPGGPLPFLPLPESAGFGEDRRIQRLSTSASLAPGKVEARDYAFETPNETLQVTIGSAPRGLYHYPGRHATTAAGETAARRLLEAHEAAAQAVEGETPWRPLAAGQTVTLKDTPGATLNVKHLVRAVRRHAERNHYVARFEAQAAEFPWRPPLLTPRPRMAGPQTAVVVGPSAEEIWTDQHGRVKVQFHWDRLGARDENASCWLRVAQLWAGAGWGAVVLPRIGQEVVVSFLDGDPDRPLVTGVVYNASNPPPCALPAEQTKTTLKSASSKDAEGFNELYFEDKAGEEEVHLHAQKDLTLEVGNDETTTIKHSRTVTIEEGDDSLTVTKGRRSVTVEAGDETHKVGGKRTLTVTGDETRENGARYTHHVTGDATLTLDGALTIKVAGDVTIQAGGAMALKSGGTFSIKAGSSLTLSAGTSAAIKAGTSAELAGGTTATVKGAASGEVDGGGMLTLKGGLVKVN